MSDRGQDLASRLKAKLDQDVARKRDLEAQNKRNAEADRAARAQMLLDLAAFGEAIGHFSVTHRRGFVVFRYKSTSLKFTPHGERSVVQVDGTNLEGEWKCLKHPELQKWVLQFPKSTIGIGQLLLFDQGLELLLTRSLGVSL